MNGQDKVRDKEIDSEIKRLCKRLRTPGIYKSYDKLSIPKECKTYLIELLESEVESRENNAIVKRIKRCIFRMVQDSYTTQKLDTVG